ncbi:MAG: integrase arm-type DNA-binding domain-containing protein [Burkholderiales bacterium]|nr:integrase arm-type DNA-binding domain-containing protein [Burkholderiales bacterium]
MAARLIASDNTIKKAAREGQRRLSDGEGLYILFNVKGGSHAWRLDYTLPSGRKTISLGTYPDTGLALARQKAEECRRLVAEGRDPSAARRDEKQAARVAAETKRRQAAGEPPEGSFAAIALDWHARRHAYEVSEGHAERTLIRLKRNVFPYIGHLAIAEVTAPELLRALRLVEERGAVETAHRIKQACGQIFRYGIAQGLCERDPSADLRDALRPVLTRNHAALIEPHDVGALMRAITDYRGHPVVRAALQLAPLLFVRPGELRHAEWAEMDVDAAMWTIPATKMKRTKQQKLTGQAHLVPLPTQAVKILRELHPLTGHQKYVFPSPHAGGKPLSENGVLSALRRMGYAKDELTGHGFRATARTMIEERLGIPGNVIEAQLAHTVKDALGRAYNRTTFLEQRKAMMQRWADYLDSLKAAGTVTHLKAA